MKNCIVLFDFGRYVVFKDSITDYIWLYDFENRYPVYCFKLFAKIKKIFKNY